MAQRQLNNKKEFNEESVNEDSLTLTPSQVSYSKSEGSFIIHDEDDDDDVLDDTATAVSGNVHKLKPHTRSLSNDRMLSAQLSQMNYNNNRVSLTRAILQVQDLLQQLDIENQERPIHLPLKTDALHVLKVQVKIDGSYSNTDEINLDKQALSRLFRSQIKDAFNHLNSLQKRVDDVSSKVFITGDVNTGKSNFCNSLLKRKLLPEDQLPCTNVFCEILEARENDNLEEVHAFPIERSKTVKEANDLYNIRDQSTYETFPLTELSELVLENDKYVLLKIYIKDDKRPRENSLLRNGTVDISLIDSPGLNMDSVQTAEVMTRQEEIDLVIFVVNAENQLTLSAKEFISLASREKKLMFFVVKKFDKIRDKQRCKDLILKQIKDLSPETYKSSSQFIHFLSSEGGGPGGEPDDNDNGNDFGDEDRDSDFDRLENSLRNFVLKKRSLSKLLPAKTYLGKILSDLHNIVEFNVMKYHEEDECLRRQIDELKPELDKIKQGCSVLSHNVDKLTEETIKTIYEFTRQSMLSSLQIPSTEFPKYQGLSQVHDFVFQTEQYIKDCFRDCILSSEVNAKSQTQQSVEQIRSLGREELGDEFMSNRVFKSELMFTKRHHLSGKKLSVHFSMGDLCAPSWEGFFNYMTWGIGFPVESTVTESETITNDGIKINKVLTTALGLRSYSLNQYWCKPSLLFTSKIPTMAVYSVGGAKLVRSILLHGIQFFSWNAIKKISGSLLIVGTLLGTAYLVHDLPRALAQNLSSKYRKALQESDYIYANTERISKEVREVLRIPTREILKSCELVVGKKNGIQRELEEKRESNSLSMKHLQQIYERTSTQRKMVTRINLEMD